MKYATAEGDADLTRALASLAAEWQRYDGSQEKRELESELRRLVYLTATRREWFAQNGPPNKDRCAASSNRGVRTSYRATCPSGRRTIPFQPTRREMKQHSAGRFPLPGLH